MNFLKIISTRRPNILCLSLRVERVQTKRWENNYFTFTIWQTVVAQFKYVLFMQTEFP